MCKVGKTVLCIRGARNNVDLLNSDQKTKKQVLKLFWRNWSRLFGGAVDMESYLPALT